MSLLTRTIVIVCALALGSCCDEFEFEGFLDRPIPIALVQGVPTAPVHIGLTGPITAALDTGSPLNIIRRPATSKKYRCDIRLQNAKHDSVSRFIFRNLDVFAMPIAPVGLNQPSTIGALLGADLLRHFSVYIEYGTLPTLTLSDEIPDTNRELAGECDPSQLLQPDTTMTDRCQGVFATHRVGGGLTEIGGETIELPPSRLVVSMCLMPAPFDPTDPRDPALKLTTGVSVMAVVSTGLGTSVISRSAFERLRVVDDKIIADDGATLHLPYGAEPVSTTSLERVAVVSHETKDLGPCGELALRRRLLIADAVPLDEADRKLLDEKYVNGASVAMVTSSVPFVVLDDDAALLQGLRKEVQPAVADVDVVIGGSFLESFAVTVDYPGHRVILQCPKDTPKQVCRVLPWCAHDGSVSPACPSR